MQRTLVGLMLTAEDFFELSARARGCGAPLADKAITPRRDSKPALCFSAGAALMIGTPWRSAAVLCLGMP